MMRHLRRLIISVVVTAIVVTASTWAKFAVFDHPWPLEVVVLRPGFAVDVVCFSLMSWILWEVGAASHPSPAAEDQQHPAAEDQQRAEHGVVTRSDI